MKKAIGYFLLIVPTTFWVMLDTYRIQRTSDLGFWRSAANTLPMVIPYAVCAVCMVIGLRLVRANKAKS